MDQVSVVKDQIDDGKRLIEALEAAGCEVRIAFWAKPTDSESWYFHLALPLVDEKGSTQGYRIVNEILRNAPDIEIDPFEVKVLGLDDSLTQAALAVVKPRVPDRPFAVRNPKRYSGLTRFGGATLGGLDIEGGALIYPPLATSKPWYGEGP